MLHDAASFALRVPTERNESVSLQGKRRQKHVADEAQGSGWKAVGRLVKLSITESVWQRDSFSALRTQLPLYRPFGLVVRFSLRVGEAPDSIPRTALEYTEESLCPRL